MSRKALLLCRGPQSNAALKEHSYTSSLRIRRQNSGWSRSKIPKAMTWLSRPASNPARTSCWKAWIKSKTEPVLMSRHPANLPKKCPAGAAAPAEGLAAAGKRAAADRGTADEHLSPLHRPPGGDISADDRGVAGGRCGI